MYVLIFANNGYISCNICIMFIPCCSMTMNHQQPVRTMNRTEFQTAPIRTRMRLVSSIVVYKYFILVTYVCRGLHFLLIFFCNIIEARHQACDSLRAPTFTRSIIVHHIKFTSDENSFKYFSFCFINTSDLAS